MSREVDSEHNVTRVSHIAWTMVTVKVQAYLSLFMPRRHIIREAILVAGEGNGVEVNADKTQCMVMSWDQNEGRSHWIMIDNSSFQRLEQFKYLGTNLTNENSIQEEIKSRLKSANACCHGVWNILCHSLLSKNIKIKIYRTVILPVVLYGCETWSLTLREKGGLRVFEGNIWA